ncbi:unnamed protein product [Closterium sp. Naga37s-1]|nr:unnamed protein product [Closterium sp. Naga37s-1]
MPLKPQYFRRSHPPSSPRAGWPAGEILQRRRVRGSDPQLQRLRGEGEAADHGERGIQAGGGKGGPERRRIMAAQGRERGGSGGGRNAEGVAEKLPPSAGREMERLRDNLARMRREALGRALERAGREGRVGWAEAQWLVEGMMARGDGIRAYRILQSSSGRSSSHSTHPLTDRTQSQCIPHLLSHFLLSLPFPPFLPLQILHWAQQQPFYSPSPPLLSSLLLLLARTHRIPPMLALLDHCLSYHPHTPPDTQGTGGPFSQPLVPPVSSDSTETAPHHPTAVPVGPVGSVVPVGPVGPAVPLRVVQACMGALLKSAHDEMERVWELHGMGEREGGRGSTPDWLVQRMFEAEGEGGRGTPHSLVQHQIFEVGVWRGRHMHKAEALLRETRERNQQRSSAPLLQMYASLVRHHAREGHVSKVVTLLQQMRDDLAASGRTVPPQAVEAVVFACARAVYRNKKRREKGGVVGSHRDMGGGGRGYSRGGTGVGEEDGDLPAAALADHACAAIQELQEAMRVRGGEGDGKRGGKREAEEAREEGGEGGEGGGGGYEVGERVWAAYMESLNHAGRYEASIAAWPHVMAVQRGAGEWAEGGEEGGEEGGGRVGEWERAARGTRMGSREAAAPVGEANLPGLRACNAYLTALAGAAVASGAGGRRREAERWGEEAEGFFRVMLRAERGPLTAAVNALLHMYLHQSRLNDLERRFQGMKEIGCLPDRTSYHLRLAAHTKAGNVGMAKKIFLEMNSNQEIGVDAHSYNLIIAACGAAGDTRTVRSLYLDMVGNRKDRGRKPGMVLEGAAREAAEAVFGKLRVERDETRSMKLSKEQRQVLAGVLLGGARIAAQDNERTYEIHFEQPLDNPGRVDLLEGLYRAFGSWASSPPRNMLLLMPPAPDAPPDAAAAAAAAANAADASSSSSAAPPADLLAAAGVRPIRVRHFATIPHTALRYHAQRYHPQGPRVIPKLIQRWLTPKTLAHWYMYSGRRCEETGGMILHAKQYSSRDLRRIARALCVSVRDCSVKMRYRRPGQRVLEKGGRKAGKRTRKAVRSVEGEEEEGGGLMDRLRWKAQMGRVALESPWDAPNLIRFGGATATRLWKFMEAHVLPSLRDELRPGVRMRVGGNGAGGGGGLDGDGVLGVSGERVRDGAWEEDEEGEGTVGDGGMGMDHKKGGLREVQGKEGGEVWSDDAWGSDGQEEGERDEEEEEEDEDEEDEEGEEEEEEEEEGEENWDDGEDEDEEGEEWEEAEHEREGGESVRRRFSPGDEAMLDPQGQERFRVEGNDERQEAQEGQEGQEGHEGFEEVGKFEGRRFSRGRFREREREKDTREEIGLNEWMPLELALYMEKVQTPVFKKKPKKR